MLRASIAAGLVFIGCAVFAQNRLPSFEAASIKPSAPMPVGGFKPGSRLVCPLTGCGGPGTSDPERIRVPSISLKSLVQTAHNVRPYQIEGPSWLESGRFDIEATIHPGATKDEANLMLQKLLVDRFQLKLHRETRELPIYALVVAKSGPLL